MRCWVAGGTPKYGQVTKALPEASWTPEGPIGKLWGRSLCALGSPLGAPGSLLGVVLGALGVPGDAFWMLFWVRGACQCKNTENLEFVTICMDLLRFKGPRASKMRSKWSLRREKEERREKRGEKREKRAPQMQKVLDPRNCLRFQGPRPPQKKSSQVTPSTGRAWVFEGLASKSAVSLRFRLDSRFL